MSVHTLSVTRRLWTKPSELFNDEDKTRELFCEQNTNQPRNNMWKGEKQNNTVQRQQLEWENKDGATQWRPKLLPVQIYSGWCQMLTTEEKLNIRELVF